MILKKPLQMLLKKNQNYFRFVIFFQIEEQSKIEFVTKAIESSKQSPLATCLSNSVEIEEK